MAHGVQGLDATNLRRSEEEESGRRAEESAATNFRCNGQGRKRLEHGWSPSTTSDNEFYESPRLIKDLLPQDLHASIIR